MGCDIHLHVEILVNEKWEHWNHPLIQRDYSLFTKMAGVRNYDGITPVALPRGLPADMSVPTKLDADRWEGDAHSGSWLSDIEAGEVQRWYEELHSGLPRHPPVFGYLFGSYIDSHVRYEDSKKQLAELGVTAARVVFWFDN